MPAAKRFQDKAVGIGCVFLRVDCVFLLCPELDHSERRLGSHCEVTGHIHKKKEASLEKVLDFCGRCVYIG